MQRKQTEPYLSKYLHSKGRRLGLPIAGNFELTARCNFNCPMCYVHMTEEQIEKQGKELTAKQWIDLAEAAKNRGMMFALLTGGEPFVRNDFFEIFSAIKEMGVMISINSNGSMLDGKILEQLVENPPYRMNISLYGGCNETYQQMCGLPMYERVLNNIVTLKENGIDVSINLSITPYNCHDIGKIHEISEKYQIHVKASSYMYPPIRLNGNRPGCGNRLDYKESAKYSVDWDRLRFDDEMFKIRAKSMKEMIAVERDDCATEMETGVRCRAGSSSFWMTWDGQMRPCGMMPGPTAYPLKIGFDAAWETILAETKMIRQPEKCTSCGKRDVCGACAAMCIAETGKFDETPEYLCKRTDEIIAQTWKRSLEIK